MACSIVGSRIDYCNSLFYGMTDRNLNKLQCVQNRTTRIVCGRLLEVSTYLLHRNFITCIGYPCAPGSSLNCQHCVFDHERSTSHSTFLTHYTHTNQRVCFIHRLKNCWLYLVVKLCLSVVDFQLLHLECGTVYHKNFETVNFRHF